MDLKNVLFVCLGNLNRSPMAQLIWEKEIGKNVSSCGFLKAGLQIPKKTKKILLENGVNRNRIEQHRSKIIDKKMIDDSSIIFCMNKNHMEKIKSMFKFDYKKIFLLPSIIGKKNIDDPAFSSNIVLYEKVYSELFSCIEKIKKTKICFPIVITSKGRCGHASFLGIFDKIPYILVLEKQDVDDYSKFYKCISEIIVLEKQDMGISYARKQALLYMQKKYGGWYWLSDDDHTKFLKYSNEYKKWDEIGFLEFIKKGEAVVYKNIDLDRLSIVGFRQTPFGSNTDSIIANTRVIQFVGINSDLFVKNKIFHDERFAAMGDEDLLICLLKSKFYTAKINHYMYRCPYSAPKDQIGGNDYKKIKKIKYLKMLIEKHPGLIKLVSENGGLNNNPQYLTNWGKLNPKKGLIIKDDNYDIIKTSKSIYDFI